MGHLRSVHYCAVAEVMTPFAPTVIAIVVVSVTVVAPTFEVPVTVIV
jgi:hypothetical protein